MKKELLLLISGMYVTCSMHAQISQGGFPVSMRSELGTEIPVREYRLPELDKAAITQELASEQSNSYMIGKRLDTEIRFPESGTLLQAGDGSFIWKVMAGVPGAKGIIMYFDQFQLPQGVNLFVHNKNGRHVLGAFNALNNDPEGRFTIDAVQGDEAYLELNIAPGVNIENIHLSISGVGALFRGYEDLDYFGDEADLHPLGIIEDVFFGRSSVCMILANCPEASGKATQQNATVHTIIERGGSLYTCSGTLINNTGNSKTSCTRYVLTASHCEGTGARGGAVFNDYIIRFKYEHPGCEWITTPPTTTQSITNGITYVSRSDYFEEMDDDVGLIKADFLLLKINAIPPGVDAQLNGWNRTVSIPTTYTGSKKFYGFHHPAGDVKVYSSSRKIESRNNGGATGTHWYTELEEGYIAPGSSGSGLFDNDGYDIGILSFGPSIAPASCQVDRRGNEAPLTTSVIYYSKFSYCWENPGDAVDGVTESRKKLSPWLDPAGTGTFKFAPTDGNCSTMSTKDFVEEFGVTMNMYPNPSTDGKFNINIKLDNAADLKLEIFDIVGRRIFFKELPNTKEQIATIDLSAQVSGIYYVKLSNAYGSASQKIVIAR